MNNWKEVWKERKINEKILHSMNKSECVLELKKASGFDVAEMDGEYLLRSISLLRKI